MASFHAARDAAEARAIHTSTEGWPAGVYLASRPGATLPSAGPTAEIHEYVVAEMLEALPEGLVDGAITLDTFLDTSYVETIGA